MKKLLNIFVLLLIVVFASCETEKTASHSGVKVYDSQKISFAKFQQETGVINFDTIINIKPNLANLQGRTADGKYEFSDFDIETDVIKSVEYLNNKTYTFEVHPKDYIGTNLFNLIYYKKDNNWEKIIVEMKPTADNLYKLQNGLTENFEGQMRQLYNSKVTSTITMRCTSITITSYNCKGCKSECDLCSFCVSTVTYNMCDFGGTTPIGGGNANGPADNGWGGGEGGLGDWSGLDPENIVIEPNIDNNTSLLNNVDAAKFNLFMNNLRVADLALYNYLNSHPTIKMQILSYLLENGFNADSKQFANQCIAQMQQNPALQIDAIASSKSPYFVDLSSVSGTTPAEIKFKEVYNVLLESPLFKELFTNLFGQTPLFNVKFEITDLPQPPSGSLDGQCTFHGTSNPINHIKIDRNHLLTKSKLNIALTILHECIHAFLNVKLLSPSVGMTIPGINNLDFRSCINTYYNSFSGNQTQHSFYVNYMIPVMVNIFQDIKDKLVTPAQAFQVEYPTNGGAFIYEPLFNPPTQAISAIQVQWNWMVFFRYFSYNGLHLSTAYPFTYPFVTNDDYYDTKYINAFNTIFNP